jgi:hypothetical protein
MSKAKVLLWLALGFAAGYVVGSQPGTGWLVSERPFVVSGNDHNVIVRTTPGQAHRAVDLAAQYCGKLNKLVAPTELPVEATRTPGYVRFDCVARR